MKKFATRLIITFMILFMAVPVVEQATTTYNVEAASKVKIDKKKAIVIKGQTLQLKITGTKKNVTWTSSKKKIATVSKKGKVTAKKAGSTVITAKVSGKKYKCRVKVEDPRISKKNATIQLHETLTLKLNGNTQKIKWSSSNTSVATVKGGMIFPRSIGTTKITAKVGTKKYVSTVNVVVPINDGSTYAYINNNEPFFNATEKRNTIAFETYSSLDALGRCGVAYANICPEIMPTEDRGAIGQVKPTGWHTIKYDFIDGMYLYNRCHLIGYQLAGENANELNLITGTRWLNVKGMLLFENAVDDFVDATSYHVLYRVTPIYEGNNLVASGVQMEGWSVEDGGEGVCFNVYVYNMQPGVTINYADGTSYANGEITGAVIPEEDTTVPEETPDVNPTPDNTTTEVSETYTYVLNTNTMKIHYPSCRSVEQMAEHNKGYSSDSIETLIGLGYSSCGICKP